VISIFNFVESAAALEVEVAYLADKIKTTDGDTIRVARRTWWHVEIIT
jgi:hypothetical protein